MILGDPENCPLLEFDEDDTLTTKEQFFNAGKKEFWRFVDAQKQGISSCIMFLPRSFQELEDIVKDCKLVYEFKAASTVSPVYIYKNKVYIAMCPLGGPAVANLIEELGHVGVKTFVAFGSCGCLDTLLDQKTIIVPTSAIRDEGLSYHYLPASRDVLTSKSVNAALADVLEAHNQEYVFAKVWTTDGIYRETPSRIERRKAEGAIAVEMECASIAAVCKFKGFDFGQMLYISDTVDGKDWILRRYDKIALRSRLVEFCYEALCTLEEKK